MRATLIVVIMSCVAGCAPRMPAPANEPKPWDAASTAPPPAAAGAPSPVAVEPNAKDPTQYVLRDGDKHVLSERDFRRMYREATGLTDLDEDARRRAERKTPVVIGVGLGATAVGGGGLALIAATNAPICRHDAKGNTEPGCGKAALGVATLAIIGAAGVYMIGCGIAKGADCILDGNVGVGGTELTRQGAEYYVGRYNEALERPEHTSVPLDPEPEPKKRAMSVQLTPFGASGTF
jgi:hypothetical protein